MQTFLELLLQLAASNEPIDVNHLEEMDALKAILQPPFEASCLAI